MWTHPCRLVLAARDEVRSVWAELQIGDNVAMRMLVGLNLVSRLCVEQRNLAGLVTGQDQVWPVREGADDRLGSDGVEHRDGFFRF